MQYTLNTLKVAVVEAAKTYNHEALSGKVTDRASFVKAVRAYYPNKKWDFRTRDAWLNMAEWVKVDTTPWQQPPADNSPKLKDLKASVYAHYQVADTKALKAKLSEWGVPFGKLTLKASWQQLWDDVQAHYQAAA